MSMDENRRQVEELLGDTLGGELYQIVMSNPRDREKIEKVKIRPVMLKGSLLFQETAYVGSQVFHRNLEKGEAAERAVEYIAEDFKQCEIETAAERATVLVSKRGKINIKRKKICQEKGIDMAHNRVKSYILEEGRPVPFLVDLGVQTLSLIHISEPTRR